VAVIAAEAGHNLIDEIEVMYLTEHNRRWQRLCIEPYWMFADTFYLATRWHRVMEALTENLAAIVGIPQCASCCRIFLSSVIHL
jgi:hypothetical protein